MQSNSTENINTGSSQKQNHGFGTSPVFLAAISTILGAILFLRFGYAVGHAGLLGAIAIVVIGHMITIPTAMAVSEIATNLRVEGGGEYYIISRSFGATVGGTIGISLYFSQAISVAFYLIAFAEAFRPLYPWIENWIGSGMDPRYISFPAAVLLVAAILLRGAKLGVGLLFTIFLILVSALFLFFIGGPTEHAPETIHITKRAADHDPFMVVFAIIFPAFTGMNVGVGMSGELKNPRRSIPLGTLSATFLGFVVYILVAIKMASSASVEALAHDQFIMGKISMWGPIVPIGIGAATLSSAVGLIMVAPRTLRALGRDRIFPYSRINRVVATSHGPQNEPRYATLLTSVIVFSFVLAGNVDFVARIISMFFMITYGSLNAISFLEHFGGNPSYRPTFKTRWYLSLFGAIAAIVMMFLMNLIAAIIALVAIVIVYRIMQLKHKNERNLSIVVQGVLLQITRQLRVTIQKMRPVSDYSGWRPSFIAISHRSLDRLAPFEMLRWLSYHYGFGTYLHFIQGPLNYRTSRDSMEVRESLIRMTEESGSRIYVDTIISPSFKTAVAQVVQIPGIAGMDNNTIVFDFAKDDSVESIQEIIDASRFAVVSGLNILIMQSSHRFFGYHKNIHIWVTPDDYRNANLMILLAYIVFGHPEWSGAEIKLYDVYYEEKEIESTGKLQELINEGRIPISDKNVIRIKQDDSTEFPDLVARVSEHSDLVITGFSVKKSIQDKAKFITRFKEVNDILFVRAGQDILITTDESEDFEEVEEEARTEEARAEEKQNVIKTDDNQKDST